MRIAVTGASGFVGGAVCRHLVAAGHDVVAYDLREPRDAAHAAGLTVHPWDIAAGPLSDPPDVDAVVHCAAFVADLGQVDVARRVNVDGTVHVAKSFPQARIVHISSCSVYDPHRPQIMATEDEAPDPETTRWSNAYGYTKALAERALLAARPDAVILRPHAIYGPGDTTLLPRLRRAARRGVIPLPGDGHQRHSITAVSNLAEACLLACHPQARPGIYNISDPEPILLADSMAQTLRRADGSHPRIVFVPEGLLLALARVLETLHARTGRPKVPAISKYAVEHMARERTFDISAARSGLGYQPVPTALSDAASW